jgi:hypothetical protein
MYVRPRQGYAGEPNSTADSHLGPSDPHHRRSGLGESRSHYRSTVPSVLEERASFHLLYRLTARVVILVAADGAAYSDHRWQLFAVASMVIDVALWLVLRRTDRFLLGPRLVLDALDLAAWSLGPSPRYDASVLVGLPLACEAGIRLVLSDTFVEHGGLA